MKTRALVIAVVILLQACASSQPKNAVLEPDQTFISLFEQYNSERQKLPVTELKRELEAFPNVPTDEDYRRIEALYKKIDVSSITKFLSARAPSTTVLDECLRYVQCGALSLLTMQSWAKAQFTPIRVERGADGQRATLYYRGVNGEGISANGEVTFVKEQEQWKISSEWFGGP